jgi:hypothetical protein
MRGAGALVVVLVLLGAAFVVGDVVATRNAEELASQRVSAELGAPAEVDLRGWPVSVHLLQGRVREVAIITTDVPLEGTEARIARLETAVVDVRIRFADLRGSGALPVDGGRGTFRADLDEASVNLLVDLPGGVRLGDGLAELDVGGQRIDVAAIVRDGQVLLRPVDDTPGVGPVPLPLPPLPGDVTIEAVTVTTGTLTLQGTVQRLVRQQ